MTGFRTPLHQRIRRAIVLLDSAHLYREVFGRAEVADQYVGQAVELLEQVPA